MYDRIEAARAYIAARTQYQPGVALILGSGLGSLADRLEAADVIPYAEIPHFPRSTVEGHKGELVIGRLDGQVVVVMRGRFHMYEGYDLRETTFPVRVLCALGASLLIVTNAAGGLHPEWRAGDLMCIVDHIDLPGMAGHHPLIGPNDARLGVRFPAMTGAYDTGLRALAHQAAAGAGLPMRDGVYGFLAGPSYETPAEMRMLRAWGADALGMSTVPEVIVARHAGMRVLGISLISNIATPDAPPANHEEVLAAGEGVRDKFTTLICDILAGLPSATP